MITYEQDPDVVRWGLQLFDSNPYNNCGYGGTVVSDNVDYYHEQSLKDDHYEVDCCNIENNEVNEVDCCNVEHDELIAQSLQEELSQLAIAEATEAACGDEDNLELTIYEQEFISQSIANCYSGQDCGQEGSSDVQSSSLVSVPVSIPTEKSYYCEEWSYPLELTDGYTFDVEVEKRLNQMISVPHVPRINGEIPSIDVASLDHQRLLERLRVYDLVERKVQGDGNCQFRALSDQIYLTPEHHEFVRQQVVDQLKSDPDKYEGYVPMAYDDYLEKMSKTGEWGDHVTLQAAADSYGVKIFVITSFKDTCYIEILPNVQRSTRVLSLSFWAEVHYNSIFPPGDVPKHGIRRKRRSRAHRIKQLESQMNSMNMNEALCHNTYSSG